MGWVLFAIGLVVVAIVFGMSQYFDKKRRSELVSLCNELGLELNWQLPPDDAATFREFELARKGRSPNSGTTVTADTGTTRVTVFEHSYITGSGKNQHRSYFVIGLARDTRLQAPECSIEPRTWTTNVASWFGWKTLEWVDDPEFTSKIAVRSPSPDATKAFLNERVRQNIRSLPKARIAMVGDTLIYIQGRTRLKAQLVRPTMDQTLRWLKAILPATDAP
jgi:hypothetical protein